MPQAPQTRSNHIRRDPAFHFFLMPLLLLLLVWAAIHLFRHRETVSLALFGIVFLLMLTALKARMYAAKVQDRVIRLEERLRLSQLLPETLRPRIGELTESQLIALRFVPDDELIGLVQRTLNEKLPGKQIKQATRGWRPDYWRV